MSDRHDEWRKSILEALQSSPSVEAAAERLGIACRTLRRRCRDLGLNEPRSYVYTAHMPAGHRLRGNSTLLGEDFKTERQWVKTERGSDDPPAFQTVPEGHLVSKVSTLLDGQGQVRAQWVQAPAEKVRQWEAFWTACEAASERYKGLAVQAPCPEHTDDTLTVYAIGDHHTGMLSWARETGQNYDTKLAEKHLLTAVDILASRTPPSTTAALLNLGDYFHAETDDQLTPRGGNKLDVDSRHARILETGFMLMRRATDRLLQKHDRVKIVNLRGNHDPRLALMLGLWLKAVYENEPRVEVLDATDPYSYLRHGKVLLGFHHGDGARPQDLPGIMAADRPQEWGQTEYRAWLCGHIHSQTRRDLPGCSVETFRTLAPQDYWAHHRGYRSGQSMSAITYSAAYGEVSRNVVDIRRVVQHGA